MSTQVSTQGASPPAPNERRERDRKEVRKLIEDRNNVLVQYYNLVKQIEDLDIELLQDFCRELVDYLAAGHFELYRRVEEGCERRDEIIKLANEIMPKITRTTEIAITFNDLFDKSNKINNVMLEQLPAHLTQLGEHLATRIDLEDQFINTLLASSNRPQLKTVTL